MSSQLRPKLMKPFLLHLSNLSAYFIAKRCKKIMHLLLRWIQLINFSFGIAICNFSTFMFVCFITTKHKTVIYLNRYIQEINFLFLQDRCLVSCSRNWDAVQHCYLEGCYQHSALLQVLMLPVSSRFFSRLVLSLVRILTYVFFAYSYTFYSCFSS